MNFGIANSPTYEATLELIAVRYKNALTGNAQTNRDKE